MAPVVQPDRDEQAAARHEVDVDLGAQQVADLPDPGSVARLVAEHVGSAVELETGIGGCRPPPRSPTDDQQQDQPGSSDEDQPAAPTPDPRGNVNLHTGRRFDAPAT